MTAPDPSSNGALPTLELRQFALRSAAPRAAPVSFCSHAARIGLVGDWQSLFELLSGRERASSGSAQVLGCELESAISRGILGFAACDVPLPGSFTVTEYLEHAARLSHGSSRRAAREAQRALDRYGLAELAKRKLGQLVLYQRRALGIAVSTLTAPPVVCLEAPVRGLDAPSTVYITQLCREASAHCRVILSSALPDAASAERSLLEACDELFVSRPGTPLTHGAPSQIFAGGAHYAITVKGQQIAAFSQALSGAGVRLEPRAEAGSFDAELPENGSTDLLLDAALDHGLVVLQLEPSWVR